MRRTFAGLSLVVAASWYFGPAAPLADEPAGATRPAAERKAAAGEQGTEALFLRIVRDAKKVPQALETSIVRYVGVEGPFAGATVELIGAVHVGDKAYYAALNKRFAAYEALLYELVAPKGTKIPKGGRGTSSHPVGLMQQGMTGALGLAYQLEEIDYTKKNFVHADLTPEQFGEKMEERGESWMGMFFKMMGHSMAAQAAADDSPELEMFAALFDPQRDLKLKRALAKQFENMDVVMGAFEGDDGSTIITERNKAALAVLKKQLQAGKKKIGVFYGAGHLSDMDERLRDEFGLERKQVEWLTAWDLSGETTKADNRPARPKRPAAPEKPAKKPAAAAGAAPAPRS